MTPEGMTNAGAMVNDENSAGHAAPLALGWLTRLHRATAGGDEERLPHHKKKGGVGGGLGRL